MAATLEKAAPRPKEGDGVKIDPPWRLSPLQNPVNVKFGEGLAVEFFDKAS